jgi:preprotein translocase subunit YajC
VIFLILAVAFLLIYLLFVRPQKKRQVQQQRLIDDLHVGAEVLTAGGIYGTISRLDEDMVTVEIAPNTEVRVARRAIAGVTPEPEEEELEADDAAEPAELEEPHDDEDPEGQPSNEENRG